jgi:hypothetical protein
MENREAINWLTRIRDRLMTTSSKQFEAMTIAIAALEKQERETQEKPFPFVVGQPAEMFFNGKWEKGKIVAGYRFGDGVVTIETEDGRKLWCGQDRTDIYRPYQEDKA